MPVKRPYFNLHQVITGQYSPGNEYVNEDGTDYIGQFHILPTNQFFTGPRPEEHSQEIFFKRGEITQDVLSYNKVTGNRMAQYEVPIAIEPRPTSSDYQAGEMERFFVQKRNSPLNSIIEIDSTQYNKINTKNSPGINGIIWKGIKIVWKISKLPKEDSFLANQRTIIAANVEFPGISKIVTNNLEFYQ